MNRSTMCGYAFSLSAAAVLLAGCGSSQLPIGSPGTMPQGSALGVRSDSKNYKIVYSFSGGSDGAHPYASLINVGGSLYGTTIAGGTYNCSDTDYYGCGTVFNVTPGGAENVLHEFSGGSDGRSPVASLIEVGGVLYGTTSEGGDSDCYKYRSGYNAKCGTVFSITPSGSEKVLHAFGGEPDGANPDAALHDLNGTLYGTTYLGGAYECYHVSYPYSCGSVYSITTAGAEKVLHSFSYETGDNGSNPSAPLINVKGTLYGTTRYGGTHNWGTVFSITTSGVLKILHSFGAGSDGRIPVAGLTDVKGTLYGTTSGGGVYSCTTGDCGTVFSITLGGKEKVVYNFRDRADGVRPQASLIELNGNLYGTTTFGSREKCDSYACGNGTVFSITLAGSEKVLHYFSANGDGAQPQAGLINVDGTLYGTTAVGGADGDGTVFSLRP